MPRYYFDIHDRDGFHRDEVGDHCDSLAEARKQAQLLIVTIAREELFNGEDHAVRCVVRDETGRVNYRSELRFHELRYSK